MEHLKSMLPRILWEQLQTSGKVSTWSETGGSRGNRSSLFVNACSGSRAITCSPGLHFSPLSQELWEQPCLGARSKRPNGLVQCQPSKCKLEQTVRPCGQGPSTKGGKSFLQEASPWTPGLHLYETKVHGPLSLSDFMPASLRTSQGQVGAGRDTGWRGAIMVCLSHRGSSAEAPPREVRVPRGCEP